MQKTGASSSLRLCEPTTKYARTTRAVEPSTRLKRRCSQSPSPVYSGVRALTGRGAISESCMKMGALQKRDGSCVVLPHDQGTGDGVDDGASVFVHTGGAEQHAGRLPDQTHIFNGAWRCVRLQDP